MEKRAKKKKPSTRSAKQRKVKAEKIAADVPPEHSANLPQSAESGNEASGFLSNLFPSTPNPTTPSLSPSADSGGRTGSEVTPEQQAQLNAVPDVIGEQPEAHAGPEETALSVLDGIAFSEEDVTALLSDGFAWVDELLKTDHWKLSERQARMLGRPYTLLANSLWTRLKAKLPDYFMQWCDATPGLMQSVMVTALVVGPKVTKQMKLSREKRTALYVQPQEQQAQKPAETPRKSSPFGGIPEASGIIGRTD